MLTCRSGGVLLPLALSLWALQHAHDVSWEHHRFAKKGGKGGGRLFSFLFGRTAAWSGFATEALHSRVCESCQEPLADVHA